MADPQIVIRNESFGVGPEVPRYWHGGRKAVTIFFNNLSIFFPEGERFFIAAVRAHQKCVNDPELRAAVRGFCGQEGVHMREHVRYNAMLMAQGYPVAHLEGRVTQLLDRARRLMTKRRQLAATAALEHFTALMAQMLLEDERVLADANPVMSRLWRWHAAEENEHKAVAFDVYRAAGGNYVERCSVMMVATCLFWLRVFEHQLAMMKTDGIAGSLPEWWSLFRFLFVDPGAMRGVVRLYFEYYRPTFHPSDIDSSALIEAWKREALYS